VTYPTIAPLSESDLKDRLGITGTTDDTLLHDLAGAATRMVEELTGPIIQRTALTVYCDLYDDEAIIPELQRPGSLTAGPAVVEEFDGSTWKTVAATKYVAPPARGSTDTTIIAGRLIRVRENTRDRTCWNGAGFQSVRVTDWTPGRFTDPVAASASADGYTLIEGFWMVCKHLWQSYTSQGLALDPEYEQIRPVWPGFGIPRAARDVLTEQSPKRSMMAGYWG
jgi:hypothetical protein